MRFDDESLELQAPTAGGTLLNVDLERAFEKLSPGANIEARKTDKFIAELSGTCPHAQKASGIGMS